MKWSQAHLHTLKEAPADAEVISHKLMLRAGLIKKVAPGIFTYGNFAVRALRKFEAIIRTELNRRSCQEILMPMVQPAQLWQETGRWDAMGAGLLKFRNRNDQDFCLGATHEEIVTDYARNDVKSYRDLPLNFYQIQTKYRDEARPRFGLIRGREFIMKDAYSFDRDSDSAIASYQNMFEAYQGIFNKIGIEYRIVQADAGSIGGSQTHEFQLLAGAGEDRLMVCTQCDFAANVEIAPAPLTATTAASKMPTDDFPLSGQLGQLLKTTGSLDPSFTAASSDLRVVSSQSSDIAGIPLIESFPTPGLKTIDALARSLDVAPEFLIKTLFLMADGQPICVLLRGSDELNLIKLKNHLRLRNDPRMLTDDEVRQVCGASPGSCGPVGLLIPIHLDQAIQASNDKFANDSEILSFDDRQTRGQTRDQSETAIRSRPTGFITGANRDDEHLRFVAIGRDFTPKTVADLRQATAGSPCPRCETGVYRSIRGIEVGHVFYLGTKYSSLMKAEFLDADGETRSIEMGCYGIGVSRTIQAAIEQSHDQDGIIWPIAIAPFTVHLVVLDPANVEVLQSAEIIYRDLQMHGLDVFVDDREERPGVKFKDADLIGLPIRINLGARGLQNNEVEVITRHNKAIQKVPVEECVERVGELAKALLGQRSNSSLGGPQN